MSKHMVTIRTTRYTGAFMTLRGETVSETTVSTVEAAVEAVRQAYRTTGDITVQVSVAGKAMGFGPDWQDYAEAEAVRAVVEGTPHKCARAVMAAAK
jgi:hypothetical protein